MAAHNDLSPLLDQVELDSKLAISFAGGYAVYVSMPAEPGVWHVSVCRGEMPPHDYAEVDSREALFAKLDSLSLGQPSSIGIIVEDANAE